MFDLKHASHLHRCLQESECLFVFLSTWLNLALDCVYLSTYSIVCLFFGLSASVLASCLNACLSISLLARVSVYLSMCLVLSVSVVCISVYLSDRVRICPSTDGLVGNRHLRQDPLYFGASRYHVRACLCPHFAWMSPNIWPPNWRGTRARRNNHSTFPATSAVCEGKILERLCLSWHRIWMKEKKKTGQRQGRRRQTQKKKRPRPPQHKWTERGPRSFAHVTHTYDLTKWIDWLLHIPGGENPLPPPAKSTVKVIRSSRNCAWKLFINDPIIRRKTTPILPCSVKTAANKMDQPWSWTSRDNGSAVIMEKRPCGNLITWRLRRPRKERGTAPPKSMESEERDMENFHFLHLKTLITWYTRWKRGGEAVKNRYVQEFFPFS